LLLRVSDLAAPPPRCTLMPSTTLFRSGGQTGGPPACHPVPAPNRAGGVAVPLRPGLRVDPLHPGRRATLRQPLGNPAVFCDVLHHHRVPRRTRIGGCPVPLGDNTALEPAEHSA